MLLVAAASSLALSSAMLPAPCPQQACARLRPPHHQHPLPLPGRRRRRHPHHPRQLRSPRCKHESAVLASLPRPRAHAALPRPYPYRGPPGEPKAVGWCTALEEAQSRGRGSGWARTGRPRCLGVRGCPEPPGAPCGGAGSQLAQCQAGVCTCCASTAAQACARCCGCARAHAAAAANAPHATTCAWLSAELRQRLTSAVQPCRATAASTGPCSCSASTNASKRLEWASALESPQRASALQPAAAVAACRSRPRISSAGMVAPASRWRWRCWFRF